MPPAVRFAPPLIFFLSARPPVAVVVDEYHQTFGHGRHGTPVDVLIDSAGIAALWALTQRQRRDAGVGGATASRARSR